MNGTCRQIVYLTNMFVFVSSYSHLSLFVGVVCIFLLSFLFLFLLSCAVHFFFVLFCFFFSLAEHKATEPKKRDKYQTRH